MKTTFRPKPRAAKPPKPVSKFSKLMRNPFIFAGFCLLCVVGAFMFFAVGMAIFHPYSEAQRKRDADLAVQNSGWGSHTPLVETQAEKERIHKMNVLQGHHGPHTVTESNVSGC